MRPGGTRHISKSREAEGLYELSAPMLDQKQHLATCLSSLPVVTQNGETIRQSVFAKQAFCAWTFHKKAPIASRAVGADRLWRGSLGGPGLAGPYRDGAPSQQFSATQIGLLTASMARQM